MGTTRSMTARRGLGFSVVKIFELDEPAVDVDQVSQKKSLDQADLTVQERHSFDFIVSLETPTPQLDDIQVLCILPTKEINDDEASKRESQFRTRRTAAEQSPWRWRWRRSYKTGSPTPRQALVVLLVSNIGPSNRSTPVFQMTTIKLA
jgi:hypothetical protein